MPLTNEALEDLAKSGLTPDDLDVREATHLEYAAIGLAGGHDGYVLNYRDIDGKLRPFYRVKIFNNSVKYKQPKNTSNHIYYPKGFRAALKNSPHNCVLIVEGEKKAARVCKAGIPAVGLGGVDSWRNRNILIPEGSDLGKSFDGKNIAVKLPQGANDVGEHGLTILSKGLPELIDLAVSKKLHLVICYDNDTDTGTKFEVQRAASNLGFELRYRGVPFSHIHQLLLPSIEGAKGKTGVDDFIQTNGEELFHELTAAVIIGTSTFPRHPNVRNLVAKKLQRAKMDRKEVQSVAMAILSDLDATGRRLKSPSESQAYYFDSTCSKLIKANMNMHNKGQIHESDFGQLLYKRYGLSAADQRIMTWLDAQFHGEEPISEVSPHRVIARPEANEDIIRYQLNDGQYVKITGNPEVPVEVLDNGSEGYLFEAGQVEHLDSDELLKAITLPEINPGYDDVMPCWWEDVLSTVRLSDTGKSKTIAAMLFYLSPWFYKWRGTQLPVELVLGESGSGKSSLCEHRLNILTGTPELRNAPADLKDWHASISNTGGLHVTDNVQLMDKNLRQRLSDEICRLVTEPDPHVEMRRLYSNNELMRIPVACSFSITAIQQPFMQADLLARAIVIELDKHTVAESGDVTYQANWVPQQMARFGGRVNWLAHHMLVVHRFLRLVEEKWNSKYIAKHRLINLEQALILMGEVFGLDLSWVPSFLTASAVKNISESDWALEGLTAFSRQALQGQRENARYSAGEIANWALTDEEYADCHQITNSRKLGRYLQTHRNLIAQIAGLAESGRVNNKVVYSVTATKTNS